MATPEELQAEIDRLKASNVAEMDRLRQTNADLRRDNGELRKGAASPALLQENNVLRAKLGEVEAQRGPRKGTEIRYMRVGETVSRPGVILSDGWTERVPVPGGFRYHAHIEYQEREGHVVENKAGELVRPTHSFECDAGYDPIGRPGTWCYPSEERERKMAEDEAKHLARRQAP